VLKAKANGDEDEETITAVKTLNCIFTTFPQPPSGNIASTPSSLFVSSPLSHVFIIPVMVLFSSLSIRLGNNG